MADGDKKLPELDPLLGVDGDELMYIVSVSVDYSITPNILKDFFSQSPALIGTPTAPTAAINDNSTKLATTAYVDRATGAAGLWNNAELTGTPTAPTPTDNDNSTKIATTAYLDRLRGAHNGIATLDNSGMVPTAQLPTTPTLYQGPWNANTNSPTIVNGTGVVGDFYIVQTAGSTNIDGTSTWNVGDWIVYGPTTWQRIPIPGNIPLSNLSTQASHTIVGNSTGGSAAPTALTGTVVTTLLDAVVGDSGSGGTKGLVPAPASGDAAASKVLTAGGVWTAFATLAAAYAPINNPTFTGNPAAPTQAVNDNSTKLATTAYADRASLSTNSANCGRLSRASATQINFGPFNGNVIQINGAYYPIPAAGVNANNTNIYVDGVAAQNLAINTTYFVYLFNNGGTLTIDYSTTSYAIDSTAGNVGVAIKTGDSSRSLVGMIRTNASAQFADSNSQRFLLSWFNRAHKWFSALPGSPYTVSSTSYTDAGQGTQGQFLSWADETITCMATAAVSVTVAGHYVQIALGVDNLSNIISGPIFQSVNPFTITMSPIGFTNAVDGYHTLILGALVDSGGSGSIGNIYIIGMTVG